MVTLLLAYFVRGCITLLLVSCLTGSTPHSPSYFERISINLLLVPCVDRITRKYVMLFVCSKATEPKPVKVETSHAVKFVIFVIVGTTQICLG